LKFLSLFSGIGGLDLGLERAGMTCIGQVEIDPFCRRVLAKHWPHVRQWSNVRELSAWMRPTRRMPIYLRAKQAAIKQWAQGVELICGGFPCQDISNAGKMAGIDGGRSGLWHEFRRIICTIRPRIVLVENVAALLVRGIDRVLRDLAAGGYDAEWDCIPAAAVGAPHRRDRLFVVAYAREQAGRRFDHGRGEQQSEGGAGEGITSDAGSQHGGTRRARRPAGDCPGEAESTQWHEDDVADAQGGGLRAGAGLRRNGESRGRGKSAGGGQTIQNPVFAGLEGHDRGVMAIADYRRHNADPAGSGWWAVEPALGRVAHGVPHRVDRLRSLGNAVVPQVAQFIGERIMEVWNAGKH
jgi:DNA (cytosine-5)-methyltransferase 1